MKTYLITYNKPESNPHIVGYFYKEEKIIVKTKDIKKEIEKMTKEVENFKTSIFPERIWKFKLIDIKEL